MEQLSVTSGISPFVYLLILFGGVASALSPCFVPVLTMFGGYIGGYAQDQTRQPLRMALAFTFGQALTLAAVGIVAVVIGQSVLTVFIGYALDRYIPALLGIVMGLQLLGLLHLKFPLLGYLRTKRPDTMWGAFTLGVPFGLVVTPCTIPIFFTIVTYLALQANVLHGAFLMIAYAVGRGLILSVVAFSAGLLKTVRAGHVTQPVERISGALILAASLYLLFFSPFVNLPMPSM
jgi:cytochrome c-type biogenesis protein